MQRIENILGWITFLLFVFMLALVSIQVGNRFSFQAVMPWTEELTRVSYIALIFVGSTYATLRNEHICMNALYDTLPNVPRRVLRIVSGLTSAGFMIVVAYGAIIYAQIGWTAPLPTANWLKMGYLMAFVAACSIAMAIAFAIWAFRVPEPPSQHFLEDL